MSISIGERNRLHAKYPDVFKVNILRRWGLPIGIGAAVL